MLILGIDPGSVKCGFGIVDFEGFPPKIIKVGLIRPKFKDKFHFLDKLKFIYDAVNSLLDYFDIVETAVESQFYSKNPQSLMKLTQAKTVVELAMLNRNIPVFEYSPREIKLAITGRGGATKKSVQYMVESIFDVNLKNKTTDISDALAVALCHISRKVNLNTKRNSPRNWREFVLMNPERVISQ